MIKRLEGKVAIVTGAGRGIGRAVAKHMAMHGAKVICVDYGVDVDGTNPRSEIADRVAEEIRAEGGEAIGLFADVANFAHGERMVQTALDTYGKLDCLINIAGILRERMVFNMTEDEWDDVIRVHLKGTFVPTKFASIYWRQTRAGGRLVNTSSGAFLGSPGQPNYAAAKAGIIGFTYSCANALARYDVTANAILPGAATRMTDRGLANQARIREGARPPSETAEGTERDPANNAPCVVYLCSDEARYISGHVFAVGGRRISLYSKWHEEKVIYSPSSTSWDYDFLFSVFKSTLGEGLTPPEPVQPGQGGGA
jgi:NAD(P)-dependent dehydrogenase (short-subunit alcohol dehydrogenase family)